MGSMSDRPQNKIALVLGGTGMVGSNLLQVLDATQGWSSIAVSRRAPYFPMRGRHIPCDLSDVDDCDTKLKNLDEVTHVFYCGHTPGIEWVNKSGRDTDIFRNALTVLEPRLPRLQHVCLLQGSKYYGRHLGPFKTPAKEDDPRHMPPNFYYTQQDFLVQLNQGKPWSWSCPRPHIVCGYAQSFLNLVKPLAVYAIISRELGLPLRYPGNEGTYRALHCATDVTLLARAMVWMSTTPNCAREAFNVVNGDNFRWQHFWPQFADYFKMECGPVQEIRLADMMADKEPLWTEIVKKYQLAPNPWKEVADWAYADYAFAPHWDVILDSTKLRKFGFYDFVDSKEMFFRIFNEFQRIRFIP
jgi:nucleoside-diphosphate-sugar epimerase